LYRDRKELVNSAVMPIGKSKVLSLVKKKKRKKREGDFLIRYPHEWA